MRPVALAAPLLALALLPGCAATPPVAFAPVPAAAKPVFDPLAFFSGRLVGEGSLKKAFSATETTRVESTGYMKGGVLHLVQQVHEGAKPVKTREWTIRRAGPNRYEGTLSSADGPVTGEVEGNRLHLAFTMDGMPTEQWLTLSPDGRSAYNTMKVHKLGMTVAVLAEDIRKVD